MQAKSLLYARRMKGDLDLGLEPSRIDAGGDRRWAQLVTPGGRLPGRPQQGMLEENIAQNYRAGTRLVIDERVYRYSHVDAERQARFGYGVFPKITYSETGVAGATSAASAYTVTCVAVAAVLEDAYAEGYLEILGGVDATHAGWYKVKGNTAQATPGDNFVVTLYDPLASIVTTGVDTTRLYQSLWANVVCMRQRQIDGVATDWRKVSCVGVPNRYVQADYWCWLQTWGPCWIVGDSGTEGIADSERCMQFGDNLDMLRLRDLGDQLGRHQIAGFVLPITTGGAGNGMYFLQISP